MLNGHTATMTRLEQAQQRCIPVLLGSQMGMLSGLSDMEDGVSQDLKRDLIAMLPRLRRFARSLTRSVAEADDLVQEACLRAIARADQWDPSQPLDRWVFRILRNQWISDIRKTNVRMGEGQVPAEEASELISVETGEAHVAVGELVWPPT